MTVQVCFGQDPVHEPKCICLWRVTAAKNKHALELKKSHNRLRKIQRYVYSDSDRALTPAFL